MTPEEVLSVLDRALHNFNSTEKDDGINDVFQTIFRTIDRHVDATAYVSGFRSRLPQLIPLYSAQPNSSLLERLIARVTDFAFTPWVDDGSLSSLQPLVLMTCSRWSRRSGFIGEGIDLAVFLRRPEWTLHTVSIIRSMIYANGTARQASRTFLESSASLHYPALHLAPVIWSWLDASDCTEIGSSGTWRKHFNKLTAGIIDPGASPNHRLTCKRAIHSMVERLPSLRLELLSDLLACVRSMFIGTLTAEVLQLGKSLTEISPKESHEFASTLLGHALDWTCRFFAGPDILDDGISRALGAMLSICTYHPALT
jgi:hypothetical protein